MEKSERDQLERIYNILLSKIQEIYTEGYYPVFEHDHIAEKYAVSQKGEGWEEIASKLRTLFDDAYIVKTADMSPLVDRAFAEAFQLDGKLRTNALEALSDQYVALEKSVLWAIESRLVKEEILSSETHEPNFVMTSIPLQFATGDFVGYNNHIYEKRTGDEVYFNQTETFSKSPSEMYIDLNDMIVYEAQEFLYASKDFIKFCKEADRDMVPVLAMQIDKYEDERGGGGRGDGEGDGSRDDGGFGEDLEIENENSPAVSPKPVEKKPVRGTDLEL